MYNIIHKIIKYILIILIIEDIKTYIKQVKYINSTIPNLLDHHVIIL